MTAHYTEEKRQLQIKIEKIEKKQRELEDLWRNLVKFFYDDTRLLYIKENPTLEALDFGRNNSLDLLAALRRIELRLQEWESYVLTTRR
jgi:hypothetical protein